MQQLVPAANGGGFWLTDTARTLPALQPGFDVHIAYGHRLLQYTDDALRREFGLVDGLVSAHLRVGLGITDWAQIDLKMPVAQLALIGNGGNVPGKGLTGFPAGSVQFSPGDLHIEGRIRLLAEDKGVGIAVLPVVTLPLGRPRLYLTDGVPTVAAKVALSKHGRVISGALHAGYRLKPKFEAVGSVASDDQLLFGGGAMVSVVPGWVDVKVEVAGSVIVGPARDRAPERELKAALHAPIELLGSLDLRTPSGVRLGLGAGAGLSPSPGAPAFRAILGVGWAPGDGPGAARSTSADRDADGVDDLRDRCPDEREDHDGIADGDGCPERDADGDGLADEADHCPLAAEDVDGFLDGDGCPDPDDDGDGILDEVDPCRDAPEDLDGFEDGDGCPEGDNDGDGVMDWDDACPEAPEDPDGFRDDDGCPDDDNDGDGIPDADDGCPDLAEDPDGFEDEDGCPERDNDGDGVGDGQDLCPTEPESDNGFRDRDGCPDTMTVVERPDALILLEPVDFDPETHQIRRVSWRLLDEVVRLLQERQEIRRLRVEVWHGGAEAQELSERRARAVLRQLVVAGVDPERIEAVGMGDGRPDDELPGDPVVRLRILERR